MRDKLVYVVRATASCDQPTHGLSWRADAKVRLAKKKYRRNGSLKRTILCTYRTYPDFAKYLPPWVVNGFDMVYCCEKFDKSFYGKSREDVENQVRAYSSLVEALYLAMRDTYAVYDIEFEWDV